MDIQEAEAQKDKGETNKCAKKESAIGIATVKEEKEKHTLHDIAKLVLGRVRTVSIQDIVVIPGVDGGNQGQGLGVGAGGEVLDVVVKVVLLNSITLLSVKLGGGSLLLVLGQPLDHLGGSEDIVVVDLVSSSDHGVEGLGVVGIHEIVPERVGTVEVGLGILNIRGEAVAGVEGPVEGLVQGGSEEVPGLGGIGAVAVLGLEPVGDVLLTVVQESQLNVVTVEMVALPRVEKTATGVTDLALGGVTDDQTRGVAAVSDNQDGTNPATLLNVDILVAENGTGLELGRGLDVGVFLLGGLNGSILDLLLLFEKGVGTIVLVLALDIEVLDVLVVVLAGDEVVDAVSKVRNEVTDGIHLLKKCVSFFFW